MAFQSPARQCFVINEFLDGGIGINSHRTGGESDIGGEGAATRLLAVLAVADDHSQWSVGDGEAGCAAETRGTELNWGLR